MRCLRGGARPEERGSSAVEFAVVLPLLLILVFGIIEFGLAFYRAQNFQAAAREGARMLSVGVDNEDVREHVRSSVEAAVEPGHVDTDIVGCDASTSLGSLTVFILPSEVGRYGISIPLLGNLAEPSYSTEVSFRCEGPQGGG